MPSILYPTIGSGGAVSGEHHCGTHPSGGNFVFYPALTVVEPLL